MLSEILEARFEGRVEAGVINRDADLAGQLLERGVGLGGQRGGTSPPFRHDQAQQMTGVADRRNADRRAISFREHRRQPDFGPGYTGDWCMRNDRFFRPSQWKAGW